MGRSIVYCDKCGLLLKEEDFLQGRASTADNRSYCAACRPVAAPPGPVKPGSSPQIVKPGSSSTLVTVSGGPKVSTTRIPRQPAQESRRMMAPPLPAAPPQPVEKQSSPALYIGIAVGIAAVIGVIAMVSGGGKETISRRNDDSVQTPTQTIVTNPNSTPQSSDPLSASDRAREDAARAACVRAYGIKDRNPQDLVAQWRAFHEALSASQGTGYAPEASSQLAKVRQKLDEARAEIETRTAEQLRTEKFKDVLAVWEAERKKFDVPDWTEPVGLRIGELKNDFERRLGMMREGAVEAKKRGDEAEAKKFRARVAAWGLPGYPEQIDQALAEVTPAPKVEAEKSDAALKALDAYRARWKEALAPLALRDAAESLKAMEKLAAETKDAALKKEATEDLENLKLVGSLYQEASLLLAKLAKGQKLAVSYRGPGGGLQRIDDVLLKIDAHRIEMKQGEGGVVIPMGEIAAATLAELFKARAAKKETDSRAAALACLLDGDSEGAARLGGQPAPAIPERYAAFAKEGADPAAEAREKAARDLFYDAELDYFDYGSWAGAAAKYRTLLGEHSGTSFVRRNKAAIAARAESGARDFLFAAADLVVAPGFKLGKHARIEAAWTSQQDLELARMKENFVEIEFSAAAESEYRCWILAGGCCQEVFGCYYQGTDLTGPDPANPKEKMALEVGGGAGILVKPPSASLKRLHSQHNGPKTPERFEWMLVGSFKYPAAGTKKIRILSNQKGFAVASAAVLSSKPGPPRDLDFKELEKWRGETPGASLRQGGVATGAILREVWRGVGGGSVGDLTNNSAFKEDKPTESGLLTIFEAPTNNGNDFGSRIRGYVHAPVSGNYTFWLASDDNGELWLSTDEDPAHKKKIAVVTTWTGIREYEKSTEQKSPLIELKAGRRYYIEALYKQGVGGDNCSVGWQLPNGTQERPIPGNRLTPFILPKK